MPNEPRITLYSDAFWISPYVFTAFVALREKGLPFDVHTVALQDREQRGVAYRDRSLTGRVPALAHGDFWLSESSAIVEYLEDAFPGTRRLLPADLMQRARARQVQAWLRSDLMALREERPTSTMFYERATKPLTQAGQEAADKLLGVARALLPMGAHSLFSEWSIADADLSFMLHRLLLNGHEPMVDPHLAAFARAQWSRPSISEFVEHKRPAYVPY